MKDFFTRYRESKRHQYVMPAIFGCLMGFALVAEYQNVDINLGDIRANVLQAGTQTISYDADLLLEQSGSSISLMLGKNIVQGDLIYVTLLGDPEVLKNIIPKTDGVRITKNEEGVYLIEIPLNSSDKKAGAILANLETTLDGATPLTLIDAYFRSQDITFALSTK